ncbi:hypothetical protein ACFVUS_41805 [Nocardia sp. NPDC058058]|uniref:hypothetical protein n=1 Tax=Nocardia sp. NPDC058058 TaxID=3346317 RepID=UPI0036DB0F84
MFRLVLLLPLVCWLLIARTPRTRVRIAVPLTLLTLFEAATLEGWTLHNRPAFATFIAIHLSVVALLIWGMATETEAGVLDPLRKYLGWTATILLSVILLTTSFLTALFLVGA